jgi:hypothetical protein
MTSRIQENQLKALFFLILFFVLSIRILLANSGENLSADQGLYASVDSVSVSVASESPQTDRIEFIETSGPATPIKFVLAAESPWKKRK